MKNPRFCSKCRQVKDVSEFMINKGKGRIPRNCLECQEEFKIEDAIKKVLKSKKPVMTNEERRAKKAEYDLKYKKKNADKMASRNASYQKRYREKNQELVNAYNKMYRLKKRCEVLREQGSPKLANYKELLAVATAKHQEIKEKLLK